MPTVYAVGIFAYSGFFLPVLVVIAGFLFPVVQQQKHVSPLPLRDLGCACDVVGDPLFAGGRLCGRRAVVVRWFVLGSVARAASPPTRWLWDCGGGCSSVRPSGVYVALYAQARGTRTDERTITESDRGALGWAGNRVIRWPARDRVRSG
jgi:hypothetical protein